MHPSDYKVLIFSPFDGGHHLNFARLVIAGFARLGVCPTLATTEKAERSRELARSGALVIRIPDHSTASRGMALWHQLEMLRKLARDQHWNRIIIPSGDGLLQVLGLATQAGVTVVPLDLPVETLVLRGGVAYPAKKLVTLKRRASIRLVERAQVAIRHHLDPVFIDWVQVQPAPRPLWTLMPDPVETPIAMDCESARHILGIPLGGSVIGCVGVLDERKGVHLLINAFEAAQLPPDTRLLLVGMCDRVVRSALDRLRARSNFSERVIVRDGWVSTETMITAIAAMNLAVTAYPGHIGSASIVLRVMAAQRPVLGSATPWIARHLSTYRAGWVANVESTEAFASDLAHALEKAQSWQPMPHVHRLLDFNSPDNFMAHWTRASADELGCTPLTILNISPPLFNSSQHQV